MRAIDELIANESNIMVFKSIHGLAPQYTCDLFTEKSKLNSRNLRNTSTDLRLQKKNSKKDRYASRLEVLGLGMAFQLSVNRHLP